MKKYIVPAFCLMMAVLPVKGQKADNYIANYQFDQAEEILKNEISQLKRRRKPTTELDEKLQRVIRMQSMLKANERVTFIDSIVVDKKNFLSKIKLGPESGKLVSYSSFFNTKDSCGVVYQTELGNKICFSKAGKDGKTKLYTSDLIGDKWSTPRCLDELEGDDIQDYPFMLSDGITLYYGAKGPESIGGYDIFVTRYDMDERKFLYPENIGMPFNSPDNDYLYAIDEINGIGWFVTDRNQPAGKVCIYIFIPNSTREVYDIDNIDEDKLINLARITSIKDTWENKSAVDEAKLRLKEAINEIDKSSVKKDFCFVVNDKITYHYITDFKSPEAISKIKTWQKNKQIFSDNQKKLNNLRNQYAKSNENHKQQLKAQILQLEASCEKSIVDLKTEEKVIRNAEISYLSNKKK